jgi:hypothetical protein
MDEGTRGLRRAFAKVADGRPPTTSPRRSSPGWRSRSGVLQRLRRARRRRAGRLGDRLQHAARDAPAEGRSYLGIGSVARRAGMSAGERFEVVVVGSGVGGGVVAGEPPTAAVMRCSWAARTGPRPTSRAGGEEPASGGRCGSRRSTAAPVASSRSAAPGRRDDHDQHEGRAAGRRPRLRETRAAPGRRRRAVRRVRTSAPHADASSGGSVSAGSDWRKSVHTVEAGSARSAAPGQCTRTHANCMSCALPQGCPTSAASRR